ncbi:MAG: prepilin-type N-terminal cleavage/methylation domain-containing protein [Candidatus Korobacteraceae bacterium]
MLPFPNKRWVAGGFTLIETMIAMSIFSVGVLALAALMSTVNTNTERSRYMQEATTLATEKLEDLNSYPASSTYTSVSAGGSLTSDVSGYNDDVQVSADNGALTEVTYDPANGCYDVFTQPLPTTGSGNATDSGYSPCITTPPAGLTGASDFHRRWLVEDPITVNGVSVNVHRVTVLVSLWSPSTNAATTFLGQPVTFQLSTVRPCTYVVSTTVPSC